MNRVNFDSMSNIKAPREWLEKAALIPEAPVKKRAFGLYRVAAAASIVLVSVIGVLTFVLFGNNSAPVSVQPSATEPTTFVAGTDGDHMDISPTISAPILFPTDGQIAPNDEHGQPMTEAKASPTAPTEKKRASATEPTESIRPTQKPVKATEGVSNPTQEVIAPTEAYIPPIPSDPQQPPTEYHGEVIAGEICFTATFPASLIEEGEPIYCEYWTSGYASPSVESDIQAQYTVTANGMVLAVYEPNIDVAEEDMITYEYMFYQNGKVLARGTQTV